MSRAVILFSHGSLLCGAGETLAALAANLRAAGVAPLVVVGYLNYSDPSFEAAFEHCVDAGSTEIVVVPYFLVAGKFVTVDLPPKIATVRRRHPDVDVQVADALRFHPRLADALIACAQRAVPVATWRNRLSTARNYCRSDPSCPLYGSPSCRENAEEANV